MTSSGYVQTEPEIRAYLQIANFQYYFQCLFSGENDRLGQGDRSLPQVDYIMESKNS